ncbi:hypothetical protein GALL_207870 [mine drainage metagenome]|uniref:Uncharacterized protein n=1 Tax=mine drainage metagenome TaxID=410659 RepID=A0A1J5RNC3_9ZZZZ
MTPLSWFKLAPLALLAVLAAALLLYTGHLRAELADGRARLAGQGAQLAASTAALARQRQAILQLAAAKAASEQALAGDGRRQASLRAAIAAMKGKLTHAHGSDRSCLAASRRDRAVFEWLRRLLPAAAAAGS